jgi:hypothetical protein
MHMRQQLLLARPWDRNLLGIYNSAELFDLEDDDAESPTTEDYQTAPRCTTLLISVLENSCWLIQDLTRQHGDRLFVLDNLSERSCQCNSGVENIRASPQITI